MYIISTQTAALHKQVLIKSMVRWLGLNLMGHKLRQVFLMITPEILTTLMSLEPWWQACKLLLVKRITLTKTGISVRGIPLLLIINCTISIWKQESLFQQRRPISNLAWHHKRMTQHHIIVRLICLRIVLPPLMDSWQLSHGMYLKIFKHLRRTGVHQRLKISVRSWWLGGQRSKFKQRIWTIWSPKDCCHQIRSSPQRMIKRCWTKQHTRFNCKLNWRSNRQSLLNGCEQRCTISLSHNQATMLLVKRQVTTTFKVAH